MRPLLLVAVLAVTAAAFAAEWRTAEPGWRYDFPRDHHSHPDFKTEWWYFTGNLQDAAGRRFGYELTFFRHGIRPAAERDTNASRFIVDDLKFAHFAITDAAGKRFRFQQKTSRGAFGEAGFDEGDRLAWIDEWTLRMDESGGFDLRASGSDGAIDLHLESQKPPVIHGEGGLSAKASGQGHASHYYSLTRLATAGTVQFGKQELTVQGDSWFDHEWATNQLAPEQVGWNWLSVVFDDRTELMLYQMRLIDGGTDPASSGTWSDAQGATSHLPSSAYRMVPIKQWKSGATGATYPIAWRVDIPDGDLKIEVRPVIDDQELALPPLAYWEGAVDVTGIRGGQPVKGRGYLELTGYAGALHELQR